jgi:hypothetical protein
VTPQYIGPTLAFFPSAAKKYGKPYGKTAYGQRKTARAALEIGGVFRPEETRHDGLNGVADAEETEEAVLTESGNHATTDSGKEDTALHLYIYATSSLLVRLST